MSISQALGADLQAEVDGTRELLTAVPLDQAEWTPHEKSMTLARLAGHFAKSMKDYEPVVSATSEELLAEFEKRAAAFPAAIEGRDEAFMQGTWTMRMGGKELGSFPRHVAMRSFCLHHVIHHHAHHDAVSIGRTGRQASAKGRHSPRTM